jgi:hypothetical protein
MRWKISLCPLGEDRETKLSEYENDVLKLDTACCYDRKEQHQA